jgi:hypothetical protein
VFAAALEVVFQGARVEGVGCAGGVGDEVSCVEKGVSSDGGEREDVDALPDGDGSITLDEAGFVVFVKVDEDFVAGEFGEVWTDVFVEADEALLDDLEGGDGGEEFGLRGEHHDGVFLDWLVVHAVVLKAGGMMVFEAAWIDCQIIMST